jgi:hypothetical protein
MANNAYSAITVPTTTTPGASVNCSQFGAGRCINYSGTSGDQIAFEISNNDTNFIAPTGFTRTAPASGDFTITTDLAFKFIRARKLLGAGGGTCGINGLPQTAACPTATITVPIVAGTSSAYVDCRALGTRTLVFTGTATDSVSFEGSDDGATEPYPVVPTQVVKTGATGFVVQLATLPNYLRCTRNVGTTAGTATLCSLAQTDAGGGGGVATTALAVADTAAPGFLGGLSAAASVDAYSAFVVTQTTAAVLAITLRAPTVTTAALRVSVSASAGSVPFGMYGQLVNPSATIWLVWNGTAWGGDRALQQNGNTFGEALVLGSNDAFGTNIRSGGSTFLLDDLTTCTMGRAATDKAVVIQSGAGGTTQTTTGIWSVTATGNARITSGASVSFTPGAAGSCVFSPRGVGAGDTCRAAWRELVANGAHEVTIQAPDALAADVNYTWPDAAPTSNGQRLTSTTPGVWSWEAPVNVGATKSSAQTITDDGGATPVTGWTEVTDSATAFDPSTGVFTAPIAGFYQVAVCFQWAATAANLGAIFEVLINVNGAGVALASVVQPVAALAQVRSVSVSRGFQLAAAGTISISVRLAGAGGNIANTTNAAANGLSITRVSA